MDPKQVLEQDHVNHVSDTVHGAFAVIAAFFRRVGPVEAFFIVIFIVLAASVSQAVVIPGPCEAMFTTGWVREMAMARATVLIRRSDGTHAEARDFQVILPTDWYSVTLTGNGPRQRVWALDVEGYFVSDYVKISRTVYADTPEAPERPMMAQIISLAQNGVEKKTVDGRTEEVFILKQRRTESTPPRPTATIDPNKVTTKAEFAKLTDEQKLEIYEYEGNAASVKTVDEQSLSNLSPDIAAKAQKALAMVKEDMSLDVGNETDPGGSGIVSVGPIIYAFRVITLKGTDELLGLAVDVRQHGGKAEEGLSTRSDAPGHYSSAAEASNAGVDTGADVVWNGVAIIDFSGRTPKALRMDEALQWNGW